ncbi:MAG: tRNA (adenosine(37)-N6)-dimethylallyltransferase MiaA [Actinomycetales bacterium]|nr:tRNA (adenosine(37)-N6)-dimethylallyltransferase MiaA [Actinomycetales bacterium]
MTATATSALVITTSDPAEHAGRSDPPTRGAIVAIVGPTATGKSDLAVEVALRLDGEVVNGDAMQLYRGMDIGTAKLTLAERRGVAHHQLDVLDVTQEASVAAYQQRARADLRAIAQRDRTPILAGGSGLYVRAALDRLDIPPTDPAVRARLEAELGELGVDALRARLLAVDPVAAQRIEARNDRRIIRALEVHEITGRPFSASMPAREHLAPTVIIGLTLERGELDERIDARTRWMWDRGLLGEVQHLLADGLERGRTARTALGYAQAIAQLRGEITEAEAIAATAHATRRFARRQLSWFRPDPRIHWFPADATDLVDRVLEALAVTHNG